MRLMLALSGGGFRATIFHMGVIRYLKDYGLLKSIAAISSVSGGSIAAAHLVLNWREYNGSLEQFNAQQDRIRKLTQFSLRNRLLRREFLYAARNFFFKKKYTLTHRLRDYYDEMLFSGATLGSLKESIAANSAPKLFLMATSLTQPTAICYFEPGAFVLELKPEQKHSIHLDSYAVASAVAASSAFPVLFPPLRFAAEDCGGDEKQFGLSEQYLTDGGIFENLGITVLRNHASKKAGARPDSEPQANEPETSQIVISNAGAHLDWDLKNRYTKSRFRALLRSADIVQYWAERRLESDAEAESMIDIGELLDPTTHSVPARELQKQLSHVRTDFDFFSDQEWQSLYDHGYCLAKTHLARPISDANVNDSHAPWKGVAKNIPVEKHLQTHLKRARNRRWGPFSGFDAYSVIHLLAITIVGLLSYLLVPLLWKLWLGTDKERVSTILSKGDSAVFRPGNEGNYEIARVFKDRDALLQDSNFSQALDGAATFDMVAFSSNVMKEYQTTFFKTIRAGTRVRLILFDPGPETKVFYDALAKQITETPEVKRQEAIQSMDLIRDWKEQIAKGDFKGNIEVRWLCGMPLMHNMWIRDSGLPSRVAHVSTYFYRGRSYTPSVRASQFAGGFVSAATEEFRFLWERAQPYPSGSRKND